MEIVFQKVGFNQGTTKIKAINGNNRKTFEASKSALNFAKFQRRFITAACQKGGLILIYTFVYVCVILFSIIYIYALMQYTYVLPFSSHFIHYHHFEIYVVLFYFWLSVFETNIEL